METSAKLGHEAEIIKVILQEYDQEPQRIVRMTSGICNEVYSVTLPNREIVIRLNSEERFLLGSHNHIPIFKARGIKVPDILAEDYSKTLIPYAYRY